MACLRWQARRAEKRAEEKPGDFGRDDKERKTQAAHANPACGGPQEKKMVVW
jgi:hypothetical protein